MLYSVPSSHDGSEKPVSWRRIETSARSFGLVAPVASDTLDRIGQSLGLAPQPYYFVPPVDQLILERCIYQRDSLTLAEARWMLAHAVGHVRLHPKHEHFLCVQGPPQGLEQDAELFAGLVLLGPERLWPSEDPEELAKWAMVPVQRVAVWLAWRHLIRDRAGRGPVVSLIDE